MKSNKLKLILTFSVVGILKICAVSAQTETFPTIYTSNGVLNSNRTIGVNEKTINFQGNNNAFFFNGATGRLGLGTINPISTFQIHSNSFADFRISGMLPHIVFSNAENQPRGKFNTIIGLSTSDNFFIKDAVAGQLSIKTGVMADVAFGSVINENDGFATELMRLKYNGRLGLGTNNPQDKFHIHNGGIVVTGNNSNLRIQGNVLIGQGDAPTNVNGADVSKYGLFVKGGVLTEQVRISGVANWADYVFKNDYKLKSLEEVEAFISENGHLPNVPSAKQVSEQGIEIGDISRIQQEKIEELTLYIINQEKRIKALEAKLNELVK